MVSHFLLKTLGAPITNKAQSRLWYESVITTMFSEWYNSSMPQIEYIYLEEADEMPVWDANVDSDCLVHT